MGYITQGIIIRIAFVADLLVFTYSINHHTTSLINVSYGEENCFTILHHVKSTNTYAAMLVLRDVAYMYVHILALNLSMIPTHALHILCDSTHPGLVWLHLYTFSLKMYSRGQKKSLRRTVEKRSVPFPLYGQPFLGTLFVRSENGHECGKRTVVKRKSLNVRYLSEGGGGQFMTRKRPVQDDGDKR